MNRLWHASLLPLSLTACLDRPVTKVDPDQDTTENLEFNVALNPKLDLLFVIDSSGSMEREQEQLIASFPRMIEVLETLPTGRPDLHLGVITTDAGGCGGGVAPGRMVITDSGNTCAPLGGSSERFLVDVADTDGGRDVNYSGTLTEAFQCLADVGTDGCGFEEPLESIELALTRAENAGFLRPDSLLAVVLLTDEDDCSADDDLFASDEALGPFTSHRCFAHGITCDPDVAPYTHGVRTGCAPSEGDEYMLPIDSTTALLRDLRPLQSRLIVAAIAGELPTEELPLRVGEIMGRNGVETSVMPSCDLGGSCGDGECNVAEDATTCPQDCTDTPNQGEGAFPPVRTAAFLSQFENHIQASICQADLSPAIETIGEEIVKQIYGACIEGDPVDVNTDLDGLQPDCSVTEVEAPFTDDEVRRILPQCTGDDPDSAPNQPCWAVQQDERCDIVSDHLLRITLHYPDDAVREADTIIEAQCMVD